MSGGNEAEWRVLGDVDVVVNGQPIAVGGPRHRAVAAHLSLNAPHVVGFDQLVDALWGEHPPQTARKSVQRFVWDIRRALGADADLVETVGEGYRLAADRNQVDAARADGLIAAADAAAAAGDAERASEQLRLALALWRGTPLSGVGDAVFAPPVRARLEDDRTQAIEDAFGADLALGRHGAVISEIESFAADHPLRERTWQMLMLARYRCGRQVDALAAFDEFRRRTVEQFGLEPSPELAAVRLAILEHAPSVQATSTSNDTCGAATALSALIAPFAPPLPSALTRAHSTPFVGRQSELALVGTIGTPLAGSGAGITLIAGEPGIGKTRLAGEIATRVHRLGVPVLYGRCDEDLGLPYQPWRTALSHLVAHAPARLLAAHRERFGDAIDELIGAGRSSSAVAMEPPDHALLLQSAVALFDTVADGAPMLIVLDDLQWADESTLLLLRQLALSAASPVHALGLFRDTEVDVRHTLMGLVGTLQTDAPVGVVELAGLDAGAASELASLLVPTGVSSRDEIAGLAAMLRDASNGNPYFFTELLHALVRTGDPLDGRRHEQVLDDLPSDVRRVVEQRVARLDEATGSMLRLASVFGREFDLRVLAKALDADEFETLDHVEHAVRAGLLEDAATGRDRFAFSHDIVHQALYADLSASRRSRSHGAIADAMEKQYNDGHDHHVGEIATQLVAADDPERREQTFVVCRRAGERAAASFAPTDAATWFDHCLRLLEQREHPDIGLHAELLVQFGTQQRDAGLIGHRETLLEAGRLAAQVGADGTLVAAALANQRGVTGNPIPADDERIAALRQALDVVDSANPNDRARLLAMLAFALNDAESTDEAAALYAEATSIARRGNDPRLLAEVLDHVLHARNFQLPRAEFEAATDELELLCTNDLVDPNRLMRGWTSVLNSAVQLAQADRVRATLERIWALEARVPLPRGRYSGQLGRVMAVGLAGDAEAYERLALETFERFADWGDEERTVVFAAHLYYARYMQGRTVELLDAVLAMIDAEPDGDPVYRAVAGAMYRENQRWDEARALLDAEMTRGLQTHVSMFTIQANTIWAGTAAAVGQLDACRVLYDWLSPLSRRVAGHLAQVTEPVDLALGRLCTALGEHADAARHLDVAADIADDFEAPWMRSNVDLARAQLCVAQESMAEARHWADAASRVARASGYGAIERDSTSILAGSST